MYLLDTNVISELTKPEPNKHVVDWIVAIGSSACLSSVTVEEMRYGAMLLPKGKKKRALSEIVDSLVSAYSERILPYGTREAEVCAGFHHLAHSSGMNVGIEDLMIAAIAKANETVLATRNVADFAFLGIDIINPFE